jgi:hypothetical protein
MDKEARYVTEFFFDEGIPVVALIAHLKEYYGEDAISPSVFRLNEFCGVS